MRRRPPTRGGRPTQAWSTFLQNRPARSRAISSWSSPPRFNGSTCFVILDITTRRVVYWNLTSNPTAEWTIQQFRNGLPIDGAHGLIVHDRDAIFSPAVDEALRSMQLCVLKTPARVPTAKAHCERFIGTVRRECLNCSDGPPGPRKAMKLVRGRFSTLAHSAQRAAHAQDSGGVDDVLYRQKAAQRPRAWHSRPRRSVFRSTYRSLPAARASRRGAPDSRRATPRLPSERARGVIVLRSTTIAEGCAHTTLLFGRHRCRNFLQLKPCRTTREMSEKAMPDGTLIFMSRILTRWVRIVQCRVLSTTQRGL
jgi:hypothetical protein